MVAPDQGSTASGGAIGADGDLPAPSRQHWQQLVEKVLRRSGLLAQQATPPHPVEDLLATTTYDGITVHPLYTAAPGQPGHPGLAPFIRGSRAAGSVTEGWDVRQQHTDPGLAVTNREIHADLAAGVTSLWLRLDPAALAGALDNVRLDLTGIVLDAGAEFAAAATALLDLASERGVPRSALHGNLGIDPISVRARCAAAPDDTAATELARRCARDYPGLRALVADGLPYHDAGGSDAEELGCTLAAATTYLRWLTGVGLDVDTACGLLEFRYAASSDQFMTIAKLRAARRLWEQVARTCGASEPARAQAQHAVTSSAMLTRRDPWTNILRATIAAFAAGVGGAQAVTVQPFDAAIGLPDAFSRRLARNTQAVLTAEAHLARVIDPAGGSWYVETLTDELAHAAWDWFRAIEAAGGMPTALDSGVVADRLAATWARRRQSIAQRSDPIVGVSEFPNLDEPVLPREPTAQPTAGRLPTVRYAEDFERLRDRADHEQPRVFLATLGPLAVHNTRMSFARNLFATGGIATPDAGATRSTTEVVDAFLSAGTPLVCLCSSDEVYATRAQETAAALRAAGATFVLAAGQPGAAEGVDGFVAAGGNAVQTAEDIHRRWATR